MSHCCISVHPVISEQTGRISAERRPVIRKAEDNTKQTLEQVLCCSNQPSSLALSSKLYGALFTFNNLVIHILFIYLFGVRHGLQSAPLNVNCLSNQGTTGASSANS